MKMRTRFCETIFWGYGFAKPSPFLDSFVRIFGKAISNFVQERPQKETSAIEKIKVFEVGVVPYEWIEYIDLEGDEYAYVPLFYCHYKGKVYWKKYWRRFLPFGYPYKEIVYYRESTVYHEGSDPADMKYSFVDEPISTK